MKFKKSSLYAVACSALAVYSAGISAQSVRVEGSGAGLTISQAAAAEFYRSHGVTVNVGLTGSVGAFAKLCRGDTDLIHSAQPISKSEIDACQKRGVLFIELPLAFDAVTVVVNLKDSFVQSLTFAELRAM